MFYIQGTWPNVSRDFKSCQLPYFSKILSKICTIFQKLSYLNFQLSVIKAGIFWFVYLLICCFEHFISISYKQFDRVLQNIRRSHFKNFFHVYHPSPPAPVKQRQKKIRVKIMNKLLANYFQALFVHSKKIQNPKTFWARFLRQQKILKRQLDTNYSSKSKAIQHEGQ